MQFRIAPSGPFDRTCQALVLGCFEKVVDTPHLQPLDEILGGHVASLYRSGEFTGALNAIRVIDTFGRIAAHKVVLVGLGKKRDISAESLRQAAGSAARTAAATGCRSLCSVLHLAGKGEDDSLQATLEGFHLGAYSFDRYKTEAKGPLGLTEVTALFPDGKRRSRRVAVAAETSSLCDAVVLARDLVSEPGNVATPAFIAETARTMARKNGIDCRVLEREEMELLSMNGILAVGQGSHQPPKFVVLEYRGAGDATRPVVLVGKGVTFDSGGISLKPSEHMEQMKDDMSGAAAVIGTLQAVATLGLKVNVVGLIPTAENLPGGGAYKPGDIVRTMSGKTVEIVNTDAEGRMLLCDALHYAQQYRPSALIDIATLTGACVVALGNEASGIMGTNPGLIRDLLRAGEVSGERLWELPLWDGYGEAMKSDVADLKNAGSRWGGTITAAWFLKQFAGKSHWAHLDIAGTAWEEKGRPYSPKGATGVGVRLLVEYLKGVAAGK
jgi:leucyl aminopeptidase